MLTVESLHDGDILQWDTVNGPVKGFFLMEDGEPYIYVPDGGSFRAVDIVSGKNENVRLIGRARIAGRER